MDNAELVHHQQTIQALNSHTSKLDAMNMAVASAAENRTQIPNAKDIFKAMAEASRECEQTFEYYGDDTPLPSDVRQAMQRVQDELSLCADAFVLYMAIARLELG